MRPPRTNWAYAIAVALTIAVSGCSSSPATSPSQPQRSMPQSSATQQLAAPSDERKFEADTELPWIPSDFESGFRAKARQLGASAAIGLADLQGGAPAQFGDPLTSYAYSTIKLPLATTVLRLTDDPNVVPQVTAAISASDNAATRDLYNQIIALTGSEQAATSAIEESLAASGDTQSQVPTADEIANWPQRQAAGVASTYGQTLWEPSTQAYFVAQLLRGCLLSEADTNTIEGAMIAVVSHQRWGLGSVPGVDAFKGGWGQDEVGDSYFARQVGRVMTTPNAGFVMAVAVQLDQPSTIASGSIDAEAYVLQELAIWTVENLRPSPNVSNC